MTLIEFKHKLNQNFIPLTRPERTWLPLPSFLSHEFYSTTNYSPWFRTMMIIMFPTKSVKECRQIADTIISNRPHYMTYGDFYQSLADCNLLPLPITPFKEL